MPYFEMNLSLKGNLERPTIRSVFKGELGAIGFSVAQTLVSRFVDSFGFSTKLNVTQLEMLTVDTIEKFAYESLEDMILFFKFARSGRYGNTDRGLDSNLIYGKWFPMFMEEKSIALEQKKQEEKAKLSGTTVTLEDVKKTYEASAYKKLHQKRLDYINKITKDMDRQMLEDTIVTWSKDEKTKDYVKFLKAKRKVIK